MGVMTGIMAAAIDASGTIMIDATYLKAHRTASNSRFIKSGRLIGRTKGRLNTKLHAVADTENTLFQFFLGAGQSIGYAGALAWLDQSAQGRLVAGRQGP